MTNVHFVKIYTMSSKTRMQLPRKFVRLHQETLASPVSLVLPCSHKWKMGLVAIDGNLYLEEGWLEFVKHYQLAHGHMLIFSYGGRSNFNIIICDKTTYEIDYTPFTSPNLSSEESDSESEGMSKKCEAEDPTSRERKQRNNQGPYNTYRGTKAFEEASNFSSKYPIFFRIVRNDRYNRYKQTLPKKFILSHLEPKNQSVTLKVGTQIWTVRLLLCNSSYNFSEGWASFVDDNSICSGDACVFELTSKKPAVLKVSIIRNDVD